MSQLQVIRKGAGAPRRLAQVVAAAALALVPACVVEGEEGDPTLDETEAPSHELARDPIIWVHGCPPPGISHEQVAMFAEGQKQVFRDAGYPEEYLYSFVFSGAACGSTIDFAAEIAELVREVRAVTGAPRVDIVAHSMGALATRLYLAQGGDRCVRDFASVGGAHHGGEGAADGLYLQSMFGYPAYEGMLEMYPPYACRWETSGWAADVQYALNGCLTPTGRTAWTDETPNGGVRYLSIRNELDEIVVPQESACLNQRFQNDCSDTRVNAAVAVPPGPGPCGPEGCPAHVTMMWDPDVLGMIHQHLTQPGGPQGGASSGFCD